MTWLQNSCSVSAHRSCALFPLDLHLIEWMLPNPLKRRSGFTFVAEWILIKLRWPAADSVITSARSPSFCSNSQNSIFNSGGDAKVSNDTKYVRLTSGEMCLKWCHQEHFHLMGWCSHKNEESFGLNISLRVNIAELQSRAGTRWYTTDVIFSHSVEKDFLHP